MRARLHPALVPILLGVFSLAVIVPVLVWLLRAGHPGDLRVERRPPGFIEVVAVEPGGPVDRAGLQIGDTILSIEGMRPRSGVERRPTRPPDFVTTTAEDEDLSRFFLDLTNRHRAHAETRWSVRRAGQDLTLSVVLAPISRFYIFSHLILYGALWAIAGFLLWARPEMRAVHLVAYTILAFSVGQFLRIAPMDGSTPFGFLKGQVEAIAKFFAPALVVHFGASFPVSTLSLRARRWVLGLAYGIPLVLLVPEVWLVVRAADPTVRYNISPSWLDALHYWDIRYWVLVGSLLATGALMLRTHHSLASVRERIQIRWLVWSILLAAGMDALVMGTALYIGSGGTEFLTPYRMMIYLIIPAGLAVSILRHDLFDVDAIIRKTSLYGMLTTILLFLFAGIQFAAAVLVARIAPVHEDWSVWIAGILVAGMFGPLHHRLRAGTERFFLAHMPVTALAAGARAESTVVFSDLVGYTSLSAEDENAALVLLGRFHRSAQRAAIGAHGRLVKTIGDAVLFEFRDPDTALSGMDALARDFAGSDDASASVQLLHSGAHAGEVVRGRDGDLFGDVVNVAHRLQEAAGPGELLLSASLVATAPPSWRARLEYVGELRLRNVPSAVRCYRYVQLAAGAPAPQP